MRRARVRGGVEPGSGLSVARALPPALEALGELAPSETTPLLLELARRQAARRTPAELVAQHERDAFVAPSPLDLRVLHRFDALALEAASEFEAVQLSPVAPLGACSAVAPTSQDRTLSAARGTEVVSDPTNVLALECARRLARADARADDTRLCTIHQVLRAQSLPPKPGMSRHFRLFCLAEAGRARAEDGFEVEAFVRHMVVFTRLLDASVALGCVTGARRATLSSRPERSVLAARVRERLAVACPGLPVVEERFEAAYYDGLRLRLDVDTAGGDVVNVSDTGLFDWMARLTSNRKLRFVASGFGIQLLPGLFARR